MIPRATIPQLSQLNLELETERLFLRPFRDGDADDIWPWVSDPEYPKQLSWAAHSDKAETRAFVQREQKLIADNTALPWAIVRADRVIGSICLFDITWQFRAWRRDCAELGYWLGTEHWGHGLMTEAARGAISFGFQTLGLHKITAGCFEDNAASKRVIEKLGFRLVGRVVDDVWRDGAWHTGLRYELLATGWSDVATTMRISRPARS